MKKGFICLTFILLIAGWTVGDDLKDWIIAKHDDGAYAVGMGAFEGKPMVLFASPDGNHQVYIGLHVTAEKSQMYLVHEVKSQQERHEVILSSIPIKDAVLIENEHPLETLQNVIPFSWDKPIAEQNLKVGDWVAVQGYVHDLIQAHIRIQNGRRLIEYPKLLQSNGFLIYEEPLGENQAESPINAIDVGLFDGYLDAAVIDVNELIASELWQSARLQVIGRIMKMNTGGTPVFRIFIDWAEPRASVRLLDEER